MLTLKVLAGLLQLHDPSATIQSDHQGIDALLNNIRAQNSDGGVISGKPEATQVAFRRGAFAKGAHAGAFRRGAVAPAAGAFRKAFARGY